MDKFLSIISIFLAHAIVAYGIAETTKDLQMTTDMAEQQRQTLLSPTAGGRPMVGMVAPDFRLKDGSGKQHRLSDYCGKKNVVLAFYPKDFTGGWTSELQSLRDELTKIQETDTVVYGISKDDEKSHREFQKEYQFGFSLLADTDLEVSRLYASIREDGNMSSRTTFVIDKVGYIRSINREVNILEHGSEVLETVQETTQYQIRVGQLAPDFVAYDENNIGYQLSAFKNKKSVVLSFYPMDMTPGWTAQVCSLRDEMSQIEDLDIQVFGVSVQDAKSHRKFIDRNNLNFPLLVDTGRNLSLLFGAADKKNSLTSSRMAIYIDKAGKIANIERKLNTKAHGAELVKFFQPLN